jgi:hypothetical protein
VLRPSELEPTGSVGRVPTTPARQTTDVDAVMLRGQELGQTQKKSFLDSFTNFFGGVKDGEQATFTSEPARSSLTEPPPGYRTPSPAQPYGLGVKGPEAHNYKEKFGTGQ